MAPVISLEKERVDQLSSQAADGNRDAFGALYDRYYNELPFYARRRVPTPEDAEDVVEQAFYKALRSIGKKEPRNPFNVWLFHITKNLITDFYRTRKQHEQIEDEASITKSVEEEVLGRNVGAALASYSPHSPAVNARSLSSASLKDWNTQRSPGALDVAPAPSASPRCADYAPSVPLWWKRASRPPSALVATQSGIGRAKDNS